MVSKEVATKPWLIISEDIKRKAESDMEKEPKAARSNQSEMVLIEGLSNLQ